MAISELEQVVFSHRVVTENGVEFIIPAELAKNPQAKSRAMTLVEAQKIIEALTYGYQAREAQSEASQKPLFQSIEPQGPKAVENTIQHEPEHNDPGKIARDAAKSVEQTTNEHEQFAWAA